MPSIASSMRTFTADITDDDALRESCLELNGPISSSGSAGPDLRAVRRNDYAAFMCQEISAKMLKLVEPCCIPGGRALPKFQRFTACWVLAAALVD